MFFSRQRLLHSILESQVADRPDDIAVRDRNSALTYRELDLRSLRLAALLRSRGVGPEIPVGVCVRRSVDLAAAFFGVLRSGGVYVPLDPGNPVERLAWMVSDAGLTWAVTDAENRAVLPRSLTRLSVDHVLAGPDPTWDPAFDQSADSLAYVIYTSGSTGRPKGVMVPHRNALELVRAQRASGLVPRGSNVLGFAPIGFDASIWEMLLAVGHGAPLHYADGIDDLSTVHNCVATLVPSVLELLDPERVHFRTVISVGERLDASLAERWSKTLAVSNAYGPAEATVWATLSEVLTQFDEEPGIGRPRSGSTIYLVDPSGRLVVPGDIGELCIGGNGVSRGYLGQPGLTASRFQANPWGPAGSRLYRTGDLARRRPDGSYEFHGRVDDQVKISGRRVELGEIENALRTLDGVEDARVVLGKAQDGSHRLVAAVRPAHFDGSDEQVAKSLRNQLPEYMIPSSISRLDSFPLTVNGKLDSAALLALTSGPDPEIVLDHPVKTLVAALWSSTLGAQRISLDDNFFSLGGHSLLASRLIARLHSVLQVRIPVRGLFQSPVLGTFLDEVVEGAIHGNSDPGADGEYWQSVLVDVPAPCDVPVLWRAPDSSFADLSLGGFAVPLDVVEAVREFARNESATPFIVYVAAFSVALAQYAAAPEVVIGASERARQTAGGPTTTILMKVASRDVTLAEAVASVRSGLVGACLHGDFPREIPADSGQDCSGQLVPGYLISMGDPGQEHVPARCAFDLKLGKTAAGEIRGAIHVAPEFNDKCVALSGFGDSFLGVLRRSLEQRS